LSERASVIAHGKGVVTEDLASASVSVFDGDHRHIECGQFLLELDPSQAAATGV
jgi:hypothetical protein